MKNRKRKVLVVDDDPDIRRILGKMLPHWGYSPILLGSGAGVLDLMASQECHCVLLDVDLPDVDGLELLRQIKQTQGGAKVIMLTGVVSLFVLVTSMRRGAEAVIFKPITDFQAVQTRLKMAFDSLDEWNKCIEELKILKELEKSQSLELSTSLVPALNA
jgi:CheY-like chemotaxis protein